MLIVILTCTREKKYKEKIQPSVTETKECVYQYFRFFQLFTNACFPKKKKKMLVFATQKPDGLNLSVPFLGEETYAC